MPKSIHHAGTYIFEGSVDNAHPDGKPLNVKYAMSLAKYYWNPRSKEGTLFDLYLEFEDQYDRL